MVGSVRDQPGVAARRGSRILLPIAAALGLFLGSSAEASSLWLAANEAGARADVPPPVVVVPVEKFADKTARDFYWVLGSYSGDLYFTALALHRCGTCYEANPLGPTAEARIALKMAGMASTGLTLFKLRRSGHGRAATVLRWSYVAVNVALAANNARHAIRKR